MSFANVQCNYVNLKASYCQLKNDNFQDFKLHLIYELPVLAKKRDSAAFTCTYEIKKSYTWHFKNELTNNQSVFEI